VGGSIATNLFTATADNASAQSFDNVVGSGITAVTPQMVITPSSLFTVDGTSTNTSLVLLSSTTGLLSSGGKVWADDGGTMKNVTTGNVVETTQDNSGAAWVQQTLPATVPWTSVTYGNGFFVAISNTTSGAKSTDGVTWLSVTLPNGSNMSWQSVTYGNGLFVAVASLGTIAATSPDGVTWTQRTIPSGDWQSVTYGNGLFVAVGGGGTYAVSSPDGITWTNRTLSSSANWRAVAYGNGLFIAVNDQGGVTRSTNGITWTNEGSGTLANLRAITYGNGLFVAVGYNSSIAVVSTDGITWTPSTLPVNGAWAAIAYGNGLFNAMIEGGAGKTATSTDGINWAQHNITGFNWHSLTFGNGVFVSVTSSSNTAATSNAGYFKKYTCTALSPSLTNVPTWVAKGGQTLAGSISTTSTPNFTTVVPTSYTATRVSNTLTITANQLSGFTSGTHVQLKAQSLNNGDVMSALNAVSNVQGINGSTTYTLGANSAISLIPTSTVGWLIG
jgi:hypothetical protein